MKKRLFASLLSLVMVFSMLPTALAAGSSPFTDVPGGAWYEDGVAYVYDNGLMNGTSGTTFSPESTTTRGMLVTILYRMAGSPSAEGGTFTDVAVDAWYADGVAWAAANGIVGGYGNGRFGPDDPITREQMAAILYRYAEWAEYDVDASADLTSYVDYAQISSYAVEPLSWANAEGLITGTSAVTISPQGNATRAQIAVILYRFCETVVNANTPETEVFTVTFHYNYGSKGIYKTVEVEAGDTVREPSDPSRSGYRFSGWYTRASGGEKFDFDDPITEDITLYARWARTSSGGGSSGGGNNTASYVFQWTC